MQTLKTFVLFSAALLCFLATSNALCAATAQGTHELVYVTKDNLHEILNSNRPVVIDVYTDWCGPCRNLAPIFKSLNDRYGDRYVFAKLNGDHVNVGQQLQIRGYPTILFFKNGKEVTRYVGFLNESRFIQMLNESFEK